MSTRDGTPMPWGARSAKGTERSSSPGHGHGAKGTAGPRDKHPEQGPSGRRHAGIAEGDAGDVQSPGQPGDAGSSESPRGEGAASTENPVSSESQANADGAASSDRVDSVARERDEYLDALRRLQAEFENYKKRVIKQQTAHLERAAEGLVDKLLPVLDTLDLAQAHAENDGDGDGEALVQVRSMLNDVLAREGLERIDPMNQPFDPTAHEAVMHEEAPREAEAKDPLVTEVFRAGYRWKGRVIRPAMVKVTG